MGSIECPKHGPGCNYSMDKHPLPSPRYEPLPPKRLQEPDDDPDFDGFEADMAAERLYDR